MKRKITYLDSIDSTNKEAERRILSGKAEDGEVIVAKCQTDGRGTHGRSFYSEGGLYMSIVNLSENREIPITAKAAVAVARAVDSLCETDCKIKWVNDIILNERKLAGILCKRLFVGNEKHVIIGIGVNTNTEKFPDGLNAVSLVKAVGRRINDAELAEKILSEYEKEDDFMNEYISRSSIIGKEITVTERSGNRIKGVAERINADGSLVISVCGKTETVLSGDAE